MMRGEESLKGVYLCVDACVITDRREGKKQGKRRRRRMRSLVEGREREKSSTVAEKFWFRNSSYFRCYKTSYFTVQVSYLVNNVSKFREIFF